MLCKKKKTCLLETKGKTTVRANLDKIQHLSSKRVGVDSHVLDARFSQWAECLLIDGELLYLVQSF